MNTILTLFLLLSATAVAADAIDYSSYGVSDLAGCFIKMDQRCEPKEPVACGGEWCSYPNVCADIQVEDEKRDPLKTGEKCDNPSYVCKEVEKPCGANKDRRMCKANEKCITDQDCGKLSQRLFKNVKTECKNIRKCVPVDVKNCKTVEKFMCIQKDPTKFQPGFYFGYALTWKRNYAKGSLCGSSACDAGSSCAFTNVKECDGALMEHGGGKCGDNYCNPQQVCTEVCKPKVLTKAKSCLRPHEAQYWEWYSKFYLSEDCGAIKCDPGYQCKTEEKEICNDPGINNNPANDPSVYSGDQTQPYRPLLSDHQPSYDSELQPNPTSGGFSSSLPRAEAAGITLADRSNPSSTHQSSGGTEAVFAGTDGIGEADYGIRNPAADGVAIGESGTRSSTVITEASSSHSGSSQAVAAVGSSIPSGIGLAGIDLVGP